MPRLVVLTDRSQLPKGSSLRMVLARCAGAGLSHVVLRELDLTDGRRRALADDLAATGLVVLAARRPLGSCAGVHLAAGQAVPSPALAPWGRSCHSAPEVAAAAEEGAQWATLSPYAASASKPGYGPPLPPDAFAGHAIPVYALGGITPAGARAARAAGAHGVAVMGGVMRAADPAAVVSALLEAVGP